MRKNFIYVDNSNLFIEGQRVSAVRRNQAPNIYDAMNRRILDFSWNLDYGRLYEIVCGDINDVGAAKLWGSPPPSDSFWKFVESRGWDVEVIPRSVSGKEKKIDVSIAHRITKDAYTTLSKTESEITLVAGDKDYVPVVDDLVKEGFHVCVAFWGHAAKELRQAATTFFSLDPYLQVVGAIREKRDSAA